MFTGQGNPVMKRSDLQHLGRIVLAVLLATAALDAQSTSGPSTVVTPSTVRRGGDGVGGIEKGAGSKGGQPASNTPGTTGSATFAQSLDSQADIADLGGALPQDGSAVLSASVGSAPAAELVIEASGTAPLAPATLILGTGVANLSFKGGTLVPTPDLLLAGLVTDVSGGLLLSGTLPDELPPGLQVCLQLWTVDAAGPKGFGATNGLLITLP
jgi:hypothetical protein